MKNFTSVMLLLTICMCSCASRYKTINPQGLSYNSVDLIDGISLEYKYNVLQKKYRKKEDKKKVKLVAVKIINNSERDITLGQDLQITYNSGTPVQVLDNKSVYKSLKQHPATYLLFLLLTPVNAFATNAGTGSETVIPVGLVIGPGLTLGNVLVSSSANRKFKRELTANLIYGKVIKSHATAYGLIGIKSDNYDALKLKIQ